MPDLPLSAPARRRTVWTLSLPLVAALIAGPLVAPAVAHADTDSGLVARYALDERSGAIAADSSGNGRDATYVNGPALTGAEGVRLDGADDYIKLPNDLMRGLSSITVSAQVLLRPEQAGPYFLWGMGNTTNGAGNGYLFATGNAYRAAIASGNWSTEQNVTSGRDLDRGVWKTLTYTLDGSTQTGRLFLDGVEVGSAARTTTTPGSINNGSTAANYIGRSVYDADRRLAGSVRDFRVYSRALSATDVSALVPGDSTRVERDAAALSLGDVSAVTADLTLPTAGPNGSSVSWSSSDPAVVSASGAVTRPAPGQSAAQVTLTATVTRGSSSTTRTFAVTVPAQPDDTGIAERALAALTVTNVDDVRGNLTLPASSEGLPVTWTSSDPAAVSASGVVARPTVDTRVTLTASVTKGTSTRTRDFSATVRKAVQLAAFEGYTFAYFTGNSIAGENVYFAASNGNNALSWTELNDGQPTLTSTEGERGLRDPFIIRSPEGDTFYLIATDLSIGRNGDWGRAQTQGSKYLEVWESHDLVTWSAQRHIKIGPDNAGNTWAPEAYYDESRGEYVVFWAASLFAENDPGHTGGYYQTMMYATTRDFTTFSEPQVWQDFGASRIDSTVLKDGGVYYRFTKDEASTTGCRDILQESSPSLTAVDDRDAPGWNAQNPAWKLMDSCIGRDAGLGAVEGPTIFKANPGDVNGSGYYLFVDEYGGRGYIPLATKDITRPDWKVPASYRLPASPRHGTVMPVTAAELAALRANLPAPVTANEKGQILSYDFSGTGSVLRDTSGNGRDATIAGGATLRDGALTFDGTDDYVDLPDNVLARVTDVTVHAQVRINRSQPTPYFLYGFGNTTNGAGNGYLFTTGNGYRTSLTPSNWQGEQTVASGADLPRDTWVDLTYTLQGTTARLYLDGTQVGIQENVTVEPGDLGGGKTLANYLGRSLYDADRRFSGQFRQFALYNRALSPAEVVQQSGNTSVLGAVGLKDESVLKTAPLVDANTRTITYPVKRGTDVTTLAPVYAVADGVSTSVASGTVRDLRSPATVTLRRSGQADVVWTLTAVEVKSPVLPGLYADPNIASFNGTFYIYATTDGTPGWGGNTFYVWKSKNLVDWTRSDSPILTLGGANGNVPWATGNAWAPTIIEKGGKYYFYFSGHEPNANRKMIGVAVADSPEGPFTAEAQPMIRNDESVTSGQAIDPAAFQDPRTGAYYLFWGNGSPLYGRLSDDMKSIVPGTTKRIEGLPDFREGLFVNYRDGLYHLTYSIDDTGSENYRVGYATSTSIDGPWTSHGLLLQKDASKGILGTGHSSIVNVPGTDDWYIAYHRFAIPGGDGTHRETTIDKLEIGSDGLFQPVTPTLSSVEPRDAEAPVVRVAVSNRTVTATATDAGSGVAAIQYRLDGGPWRTYEGPLTVDDAAHTVDLRATDKAGNVGTAAPVAVAAKTSAAPPVLSVVGTARTVTVGQSVSPGAVAVKDASGNPMVGVPVTFVVSGPATFAAAARSVTVTSDAVGMAVSPIVDSTGAGTVSVAASAPRATTVNLPAVTVVTASAALTVERSASAAKVNGKVQITASLTNTSTQTVTVQVRTPYGTKTFASVAAGATVSAVFKTSLASVADGKVTATVSTANAKNTVDVAYRGVR